MRYLSIHLVITLMIITVISGQSQAANQEAETIIIFDLEEDDGSFLHGGYRDVWEWGIPGKGNISNPGPSSSGEGKRCFGSPLNGTYEEGTRAYLEIPTVNLGTNRYFLVQFLLWYDLELREDEGNWTGPGTGNDHLLVQVRNREGEWTNVGNYSGDSGGIWTTEIVDLSSFEIDELHLRFLLVDIRDGKMDNGVFIDMVIVQGVPRPIEDISLSGPPKMAKTVATFAGTLIHFTILNEGNEVPPDSRVNIKINGPEGWMPFEYDVHVTSERISDESVRWTPTIEGVYVVYVNLTVNGRLKEEYRAIVRVIDSIFYDDLSLGLDLWETSPPIRDHEWYVDEDLSGITTSSGGSLLRFGEGAGFSGSVFSWIESPDIDLGLFNQVDLHIFHSYGFLGEPGSCGGVVQARGEDGNWITLNPYLPHTRELMDGISGPLEGESAFQGDKDWYQIGFDLDELAGKVISIRFSVSSGDQGEGRGWLIDDILVTGEGMDPYDDQPPQPVEGIGINVIEEGVVEVSWSPSFAIDMDHYNIYMGSGEFSISTSTLVLTLDDENDTSVTLKDLDPGQEYWTAITAVDRNGNEDTSVSPRYFYPSISNEDQPPVARARIQGSSSGLIGSIFIFNASSSYDPEGGTLDYLWTMPDGTILEGEQVSWEATVSGDMLTVRLMVTDRSGLVGYDNLTIDVHDGPQSAVESEDLSSFVVCMIPVIVALITAVIIIAWIRNTRQRKIRKGLLMMGIETEKRRIPMMAEVIEPSSKVKEKKKKHILDLEPMVVTHPAKDLPKPSKAVPPPPSPPVTCNPREGIDPGHDQKDDQEEKEVVALLECPFCGSSFKKSLKRSDMNTIEGLRIECPDCGKPGTI